MIARSLSEAAEFNPCALTIGNFDGVHLAHRRLLRATVETARAAGLRPALLMFDPHPTCVVAPERAPRLLTSLEERCGLIREEGIEQILIQPFTAELARLTPEGFAKFFLRAGLGARVVVVGENFRVYITRTADLRDGRRWNSITNIGYRPTFGSDDTLSIETFLLDPLDGETPERIRLEFLRRVRDERKFENPEALKAQILRDVGRARAYFRRLARWVKGHIR